MEEHDALNRKAFGQRFKWGVSTAAYQVEGSHDADGKGPSIWDVFSATKGKVLDGHHGNIACDFYRRYPEDLALASRLHIPNLRFSFSWSRIMPNGTRPTNQQGLDHYDRLIDKCLEFGIDPWVTLYHWDLPQALEMRGGWTNRDIVNWFSDYVAVCADRYGDRVKHWMVMNEPMVFTGAGYFLGVHAPGKMGMKHFMPAIHHAVMSMSAGGRVLRELLADIEIGTTFSCTHLEPAKPTQRNIDASLRADALLNRLFIEPILGLGYPTKELPVLKRIEKYMLPGDEASMPFEFDFIGIQNYTRDIIKHSFFTPYLRASLIKAKERKVPITSMGWEVYPASIYHMLKKYDAYTGVKKIYVTENGAAFPDQPEDGKVNDELRKRYLQDYLKQVLKAKNEGVNVEGYFVWTLTDNFEWAEGYHPRFGIVYVDFEIQERIVKDSGHWYASFLGR